MCRRVLLILLASACWSGGIVFSAAGEEAPVDPREVRAAMRKAAEFYCEEAAVGGGYVYHYTLDFSQRWGEGLATEQQIWVQPPGTPTVGMAFLDAYRATGEEYYLNAAREAARALVYGQLRTGGWRNAIDLSGRDEGRRFAGGSKRLDGFSSLDDGQTQSAIQFLVLTDEALEFKDPAIHESALFALDSLLSAQFPNGGFPQGWKAPAADHPVLRASYPGYDWRSEGRIKNYWDMYTLNDNVCGYIARALITAHRVYADEKYKTALSRLGDFLILAQMPDPQPAWAQQYNYQMHPIWARKFEPPGISGDESQEAIETLLKIYEVTGDRKHLEPIPRAIKYLRSSELSDGQLARYYELKTNRPLYMVRKSGKFYELTYDDSRLPKHYSWKTRSRMDALERRYEKAKSRAKPRRKSAADLEHDVRQILAHLDQRGRWVSVYDDERLVGQPKFASGEKYLSSAVFSRNLSVLSDYLAAANEPTSQYPLRSD